MSKQDHTLVKGTCATDSAWCRMSMSAVSWLLWCANFISSHDGSLCFDVGVVFTGHLHYCVETAFSVIGF